MPTDPIKHVVVLMLENHSFDQMLGSFRSAFSNLEGVDQANLRSNRDNGGRTYSQAETTATSVPYDPMHELANVLHQLENDNGNFVLDYSEAYPATTPDQRQQIMGYFAPGSLPALHEDTWVQSSSRNGTLSLLGSSQKSGRGRNGHCHL